MNTNCPVVVLGNVLHLANDVVNVDLSASYPIAGVYSFGRGLFARVPISGTETTYKVLHRLHKDDFVLSQLKGWEGAIARVPNEFDGWFLSPQFQTFRASSDQLTIGYLEWFCKQAKVWEELKNRSRGMGARRDSVSPTQFLSISIPLPPMEEQRRIVARIEELATRIEAARKLRREAVEEREILVNGETRSVFKELGKLSAKRPLKNSATIFGGGTPSKDNYAFWQGTIPWVSPKDMKVRDVYETEDHISTLALESGASRLIPENSVLVVVRSGILRRMLPVAVNRVVVTINQDMKALIPSHDILCDFLAWWFRGNEHDILKNVKGGTTVQSVVWDKVSEFNICIPPLLEQHRIVVYLNTLQSKVDSLKQFQSETSAELDALLPSILDKAFKGEL